MNPWKAGVAWVLVLVVATALTWQIVSFADSQVSAQPVEVQPTNPPPDTTSTSQSATSTTSPSSTTISPDTTSTSQPDPTSTTQAGTTSTSEATTATTTGQTTSTTESTTWSVRTVTSPGGTVVVRYRPGEVELQAATPAPGFDVEIEDAGPTRVRVEFESDEDDIRVDIEWRDGGLDVEIED